MQGAKCCFNYQFIPDNNIEWLFVIFIDSIKEDRLKEYEFFYANKLFIEVSVEDEQDETNFSYQVNCLLHDTLYTTGIKYSNIIICGDGEAQCRALPYAFNYNFENLFLYTIYKETNGKKHSIENELIEYLKLDKPTNVHIFTSHKVSGRLEIAHKKVQVLEYNNSLTYLKRFILNQYIMLFYNKPYQGHLYVYENQESIEAYLESNFKDIEVAFYIFRENQRVKTRWYSTEPSISHTKQEEGEYKVAAFIKCKCGMFIEEQKVNCLSTEEKDSFRELKNKSLKKYIDIHGSCVSRDLFNFPSTSVIFSQTYCARTSLFACLSRGNVEIDKNHIELESKFRRRSLEYDLDKTVFITLKEGKGTYLMVDLVDTVRFLLLEYKGSVFTGSTEFTDSKLSNHYDFKKINPLDFSESEWKYYISLYSEKLKNLYEEPNIIIHCVYFKNEYVIADGEVKSFENARLRINTIYNEVLQKWYEYLRSLLPNAIFIDICKQKEYLADEEHHYGLAPVHYSKEYYKEVLNQLEEVFK